MAHRIKSLYTSKTASCAFSGASTFKKSKEGKKYSKKEIHKELHEIPAYVLHKPCIKKFPRRFYFVPTINHQFGADLIEIRHPKSNYGKRYILAVLDHFSRSAWLEALRDKTASTVLNSIQKIFKRTGRKCKFFESDGGREFVNEKLKSYFEQQGIKHFISSSSTKCAINERFNRTIGQRIARYLTQAKSRRFVHKLPLFERQYNNSFHRTIKATPNQVTLERVPEIQENIYGNKFKQEFGSSLILKVGQKVLIPANKKLFAKGYDANWDNKVYTIVDVRKTQPTTYTIKDPNGRIIKGGWYRNELNPVPNGFNELVAA